MDFIWRNTKCQLFHHFQRHHFACNFGKAFCAALNLHKALLVETHNIASVIPAALHFAANILGGGHFQYTWLLHPQIAVHYVRPFQLQASALFDTRNRQQARIHSW